MVRRKIGNHGRLTIPKEFLDKYNINQDDILDITDGNGYIKIQKYTPKYYCVVTGKVTEKGKMFGNSFISNEGIEIIKQTLKKKKESN